MQKNIENQNNMEQKKSGNPVFLTLTHKFNIRILLKMIFGILLKITTIKQQSKTGFFSNLRQHCFWLGPRLNDTSTVQIS